MKGYRKFLAVMLGIMILSSFLSMLSPICLQIWNLEGSTLNRERIVWIIILLLLTNLFNVFLILYRENYANKFNKENARTYLGSFLDMKYERIIQEGPSNLLERIVTAVTNIYAYMTGGYIQIWSSVFIAALSVVLVGRVNVMIAVLMLLYIPLVYGGFKLINNELAKRSTELQTHTGAGFQEILSYMKEPDYYKQLPNMDAIIDKMSPALDKIYDAMARINKFAQTSSIAISSLGTILQNVILLLSIYSFMETKTSPYTLMMITMVVPLYFDSVRTITRANIDKKSYEAALDLKKMLKDNQELNGDCSLEKVENITIDVEQISINDKEIDFEAHAMLKKGDIGRIYGKSGSGKSTLAKAILKFRQTEGIKINGIDLENIDNQDLRKCVEYVSQNIPIIRGTLRDNLLFGKEYLAVTDSYLMAHPLLQSIFLKKKLDDEILESGANLSGGEKQKIAIVRALLSEPEILILDEVCSSIDARTSEEIYAMLMEERDKRITIVISHDEITDDFANVDINRVMTD